MSTKINTIPPKRLSETITAASTSFKLNDILGFDGIALSSSIVGDVLYASFQNTTGTIMELMKIDPTTIASTSITILKRGLSFNEDGTETEVSGNKLQWIKNQTIVNLGTDTPAMYNNYVKVADAQTINGVKTFGSIPVLPASDPTTDNQATRKIYVDTGLGLKLDDTQLDTDVTLAANSDTKVPSQKAIKQYVADTYTAGGVNASTTQQGFVEEATQAEFDASTDTGATGARLFAVPSVIKTLNITSLIAGETLATNDALIVSSGNESRIISATSTQNTTSEGISNTQWIYQSFITGANTTKINQITGLSNVSGTGGFPNSGTLKIRATPTGADLISVGISFDGTSGDRVWSVNLSNLAVSPSTTYYIIIIGNSGGGGTGIKGGTTSSYSGGVSGISTNSGSSWTTPSTNVTGDFYFTVFEVDTVAGKVYKANANSALYPEIGWTSNFIGFAITGVAAAATVSTRTSGVFNTLSSLTPGTTYYLSNTAGIIAASAGTVSKKVGLSLSATELLIKHDN